MTRFAILASLASVLCFALIQPVQAQINNVTNTTSTPIPGAGHDYIKLLSETVNPANGSVSMRITLPTPKSRGITLPFSISYDSNGLRHLEGALYPNYGSAVWKSDIGFLAQNGWSYSVPTLNYNFWETTPAVLTGYNAGQPAEPIYTYYHCWYSSGYLFAMQEVGATLCF